MASYNALNSSNQHPSPYGSGDPYYNESSGFITPHPVRKKRTSNWIKFGIPVLVIVIIAAVVGGVVGSRKSSTRSSSSSGGSSGDSSAAASSAVSAKLAIGEFPTATNSEFMVPLYPSTVRFHFPCIKILKINMCFRQMLQRSQRPLSSPPVMHKLPGLKTPSPQPLPTFRLFVQTDHVLLPPLTSGKPFLP